MSDVDNFRRSLGIYDPTRDLDSLRNLKSPEQRQAEWNQISSRALLREQGRNLISVITKRVTDLEAALQQDEALAVYCDAGHERIVVREFEFPTWHLAIISGLDENGNQTQRIENVQDVKLTCKVVKAAKKTPPIGFRVPEEGR